MDVSHDTKHVNLQVLSCDIGKDMQDFSINIVNISRTKRYMEKFELFSLYNFKGFFKSESFFHKGGSKTKNLLFNFDFI